MDRARKFVSMVSALAMTAALAMACDSGTQEPDAPDQPAQTGSADGVQATGEIPESRFPTELPDGAHRGMPESQPKDLPIYPGSVPAMGKDAMIENRPMTAVQLLTMDETPVVYNYYSDKFASDGWTLDERPELAGKNALSASNGKCKASVLIVPVEDGEGSDIFLLTECDDPNG
jgi:hypothetical protein